MANRIQLRRGSAQEWSNVNPTLAIGELGIEIDTGRIKIGDGVTAWNSLRYERPLESVANSPNTLVQRDSDGNFSAGAITASLIGNAATATRLANVRQIALTGELSGSATFDGSSNLNISSTLALVPSLPHYNGTPTSEATYTKVTVDAKGRVVDAENPTSIQGYGLDGVVEGQSAQPFDRDLQGISDLTTVGHIVRVSDGNIATRTVTGTAGRISVVNGSGVAGNPTLDLINTTVSPATYNTPTIAGATQTIFATRFTVDQWGRFTYAEDFPIATAVEGTTAGSWTTGSSYSRYDKVTSSGRLYQALNTGTSGATAPVHTTGDASDGTVSWRHLGLVTTRQKGLSSFDQEDFDVDVNGHVQIAAAGVDNTQLQNNQIRFADGNSYTAYELDNELTSSTGYRGITTINDLSVNNTSGSPLLKCLAADDNVDINTTTSTIFSDITLDKTSTAIQTINRAGSLTILMDANTASNRFLRLTATNAGAGEAKIEVSAENSISIDSINSTLALTSAQQISLISSSADVRIEDFYFANNVLSSTNSTIVLDPAGIGDDTGTVQIKGNLQVDGTTTTVNSTTITIDDVILTLGGDQTPTTDDNKDRGVEFKYYDTQARLGFYGWDDSYTTLSGTTGGYRFLYDATNTSEVFSGTDAGVIAGNLALSSNVGSTSTSTGTLVVTGGTGISQNLWVGGTANVAGNSTLQGTLSVTDNVTLNKNVTIVGSDTAATELFKIQNASAVDKFTVDSSSGNTSIVGTVTVTDNVTLNKNVTIVGSDTAATEYFKIQNASASDKFVVDSSSGNTTISGTLGVTGASTLTGTITLQSGSYFISNNTDVPTITTDVSNNYVISGADYGSFRFDGGGYIAGNTLFNNDVYVNGTIIVKDTGGGGTASTVNNLSVRYTTVLGSTLPYTPAFATSTTSNLRVTGGAGIATSLHIGGTGASEGLFVGKKINSDSVKFQVLGASGNTSISGTLGVTGATSLSNTLGVTGITSITNATDSSATNNGALVVTGGVGIGAQLRVAGNTTLTGDLAVNGGDLTSSVSTFNLLASPTTVNIAVAGTIVNIGAATGTTTINNNLTIGGNLTVSGSTTYVNSTVTTIKDPVITLGGTDSGGNATSDDNKDRGIEFKYFTTSAKTGFFGWDDSSAGYRFLEDATNTSEVFSGTDAVLYAGSINLSKAGTALSVTNNASIGGTFGVTGTSTFTGLLTADGGADIKNVQIGVTAVNEIDTIVGNLVIDSAGGTTTVDDALTVSGLLTATAGGDAVLTARDARKWTTARTLSFTGDATGSMSVDGTANASTALTLATVATAGTYKSVTINAKGLVTSGSNPTTLAGYGITDAQGLDSDLTAIAGLTTTGIIVRTATGAATTRSVTVSGTGLSISDADGVAGNISITSNATSVNNANTIVARNASGNFTAGTITAALSGNATTATTLETARTIGISGDGTGTATSFNGSANITIPFTLANSGVTAGTYTKVTVDAKGRVTTGATASADDLTAGTTNLFFTDERAQDAVATALTTNATHSGVTVAYNDAGNAINITRNTLSYSTQNYSGDGSTVAFVADTGRDANSMLAIVDGLIKTPTVEYTYFDQVVLSGVGGHNGESTITVSSNTGLTTGMPVSGSGIGTNARITGISGTTITLSVANTSYLQRATISSVSTYSGTSVPGAGNQTYTGVAATGGTGSGATFNVVRAANGSISSLTINNGGKDYANGQVLTIPGASVGGTTPTNNILVTIGTVTTTTTTGTFSSIVKFDTAPTAGTNNVSIRYLPL
jgi:Major tropism determinant N-terminal domain